MTAYAAFPSTNHVYTSVTSVRRHPNRAKRLQTGCLAQAVEPLPRNLLDQIAQRPNR